jgi:flagellar hook-associated protein 3 FlgL
MTTISSSSVQATLVDAMDRIQRGIAASSAQIASGEVAPTLSGLGAAAVPMLSAHSVVARQQAYAATSTALGTTLALYDTHISSIDSLATNLQHALTGASGAGTTAGLQTTIEDAFTSFRDALNAQGGGGGALFGGSQTDGTPFVPQTLQASVGLSAEQAFGNDDVLASARVADHRDMTYGITARQLGGQLLTAFQTLASAGTIGATPSKDQEAAMTKAVDQISTALTGIRAFNAANGQRQAQVETLQRQANDSVTMMQSVISETQDADLSKVATTLANQQTQLQISYSAFSRIAGLSLVNFLK